MLVGLFVLFWAGLRAMTRRDRRLQRTRRDWRARLGWLALVLVWSVFLGQVTGVTDRYLNPWTSVAISLGIFVAWMALRLIGPTKANKLNQQIVIAISSGDYPKALTLAEAKPAVVAGNTELRYNYALIRVILGRRAEALADLERLREDDPRFKMTSVLLLSVYADDGEYARALELAEQLSRDLPKEPVGPHAESWLLRKLGRPEEAEKRAREALEVDPRSGLAYLTLGGVALDRGDHAAAREQLARAEKLVPGSTDIALFAAEIALATNDAGAEAAVRHAVDAAKNNPLAFADQAAAALVRRFELGRQAVPR
jgi:tetratricopeptide (TPR) repeat protein